MGGVLEVCCTQSAHKEEGRDTISHMLAQEAAKPSADEAVLNDVQDRARMDAMKGAQRRNGVAAECVATADVRDYKKPVYPKDEASRQRIQDVLRTDMKMQVLFGHLDDAGIGDIVNAFKDRKAALGEVLIRQGDEGDCLYVVDEGEVDIFVARPQPDGSLLPGDRGSKVVTFGPNKLFGELALMYSAPRAATAVVASSSCRLWQLDREPFKMLLVQKSQTQQELYEGWLAEVDILRPLNRYELSRLSDLLQSELYDTDEVIVEQGTPGDKFYILEDGTCGAFRKGADGEKLVMEYSQQGQYFGEIALLNDAPRQATVRATGEGASVLSISKEDFVSVLGPIEDILRKHIEQYPQDADLLKKK
mmetsp:Transcript_17421/g.55148  ORF Transcript_17421/g.55148 Transcript_17421/m.55148 type:complete len:363 (-) Transcript_17421:42-1130(-)